MGNSENILIYSKFETIYIFIKIIKRKFDNIYEMIPHFLYAFYEGEIFVYSNENYRLVKYKNNKNSQSLHHKYCKIDNNRFIQNSCHVIGGRIYGSFIEILNSKNLINISTLLFSNELFGIIKSLKNGNILIGKTGEISELKIFGKNRIIKIFTLEAN